MLNKESFVSELVQFYEEHNINPLHCYVSHGGAMLMHGLRIHTEDIDLSVSREIWDRFAAQYEVTHLPAKGQVAAVNLISVTDNIDIHCVEDEVAELVSEGVIQFTSLKQTYTDKVLLSREKDIKDIEALAHVLYVNSDR